MCLLWAAKRGGDSLIHASSFIPKVYLSGFTMGESSPVICVHVWKTFMQITRIQLLVVNYNFRAKIVWRRLSWVKVLKLIWQGFFCFSHRFRLKCYSLAGWEVKEGRSWRGTDVTVFWQETFQCPLIPVSVALRGLDWIRKHNVTTFFFLEMNKW